MDQRVGGHSRIAKKYDIPLFQNVAHYGCKLVYEPFGIGNIRRRGLWSL